MDRTLRIDPRFCGPPGRANGGYLAGLIAAGYDGPIQFTLRRPVPLDTPIISTIHGETTLILHENQVLAEAVRCNLDLDVPAPPDFETAVQASTGYAGRIGHPFPDCFVCGPHRATGDGLRIFAGPVEGRELVAAPWIPEASIAGPDGIVPAPMMWAALDCPGAFASTFERPPVASVLGRIAGVVHRCVAVGDHCVVIAWPIAREGRKQHVGTAIVGPKGEVRALAQATWFEIKPEPPIG